MVHKILFALLLVFTLALTEDPLYIAKIPTKNPSILYEQLKAFQFDVLKPTQSSYEITVVASKEEVSRLKQFIPDMSVEVDRPLQGGFPGYHNVTTINKILQETESKYPNIAKVYDFAKEFGPGFTWEKRGIYGIKISDNVSQNEDEPNVLIVAAHHAREIITPEIALYIIEQLTSKYSSDPVIKKIVDTHQIWVIPVINVDGTEYVWTKSRMWRKNRRPESNGVVYGVDNNRNYDLDWEKCGGSSSPSSETYKGPASFSEPECQTIRGFAKAHFVQKVLDFHSYGREVLYGYHPCTKMDPKLQAYSKEIASRLASKISYRTRYPSGNGQHQSWHMKENTMFSFLVETHTTFQPSYAEAVKEAQRVWPLVLEFFAIPPSVQGYVKDEDTNQPLGANYTISEITWYAKEGRRSEPKWGRYHEFLAPGSYTFKFQAPGYQAKTVSVTVKRDETVNLDIKLKRN